MSENESESVATYKGKYHTAEIKQLSEATRKDRESLGYDGTIQAVVTLHVDVGSKFNVPARVKSALTTLKNAGVIEAFYLMSGYESQDKLEIIFHANEAIERKTE